MIHLRVSESHTADQSQSIEFLPDSDLRARVRFWSDQHALPRAVLMSSHEAVMAVDGWRCRALLARSLTSQSCLNRVGQSALFSLRSAQEVGRCL